MMYVSIQLLAFITFHILENGKNSTRADEDKTLSSQSTLKNIFHIEYFLWQYLEHLRRTLSNFFKVFLKKFFEKNSLENIFCRKFVIENFCRKKINGNF